MENISPWFLKRFIFVNDTTTCAINPKLATTVVAMFEGIINKNAHIINKSIMLSDAYCGNNPNPIREKVTISIAMANIKNARIVMPFLCKNRMSLY
jgi:hypothetical protein